MNPNDFVFKKCDGSKYYDYWFEVVGETKEHLTNKYMEQSMVCVSEAVFSIQDGQWGIKRVFPFNYDVITPDDNELYEILKSVAFNKLKQLNKTSI